MLTDAIAYLTRSQACVNTYFSNVMVTVSAFSFFFLEFQLVYTCHIVY